MSFKINAYIGTISIRFKYQTRDNHGQVLEGKTSMVSNKRISTTCTIDRKDPYSGDITNLSEGVAVKCKEDKIDKGLGRRMALARALHSARALDANDRKAIWSRYFELHRDGKKLGLTNNEKKTARQGVVDGVESQTRPDGKE